MWEPRRRTADQRHNQASAILTDDAPSKYCARWRVLMLRSIIRILTLVCCERGAVHEGRRDFARFPFFFSPLPCHSMNSSALPQVQPFIHHLNTRNTHSTQWTQIKGLLAVVVIVRGKVVWREGIIRRDPNQRSDDEWKKLLSNQHYGFFFIFCFFVLNI